MKKNILVIVIVLLTLKLFSQTPPFEWAKKVGGTGSDNYSCLTVDGNGNSYVTGLFQSPVLIIGTDTLTNAGGWDIFVAKYDSLGNVLWAKREGRGGYDDSKSIVLDSDGNCYITGTFTSASTIIGTDTLMNAGTGSSTDMFIAKYDSNGNFIWSKRAGGNNYDESFSIATDSTGHFYITGEFSSTTISFDSYVLTNAAISNTEDFFIAKYDSSGNVIWAKSAGGYNNDEGLSIVADASGNSYVTGRFFSSSITFGSITLPLWGSCNVFVVKYDPGGNVVWAKRPAGNAVGNSIAHDIYGNSYVTGNFGGASISFGSIVLNNAGSDDVFTVKYDSTGNEVWARQTGGNLSEIGESITVDESGNSYITGWFANASLNLGAITLTNYIPSYSCLYIIKYDTGGNVIWGRTAKFARGGNSIAVNGMGQLFVTGFFYTDCYFDSDTLIGLGSTDIFITKIGGTQLLLDNTKIFQDETRINIYPNPFASQTTIVFNEEQKQATIKITDLMGKEIDVIHFSGKELILNKGEMHAGIYFVQIIDENKTFVTKKIIIQ
jgi:hypothetical protein